MKQRNISKGIYSLYVIMFMLMIPIGDLWAQDPLNISGKVVDVNNEPLIGATVQVKGKQTGTITNIEGRFSFKVQAKDILVISYMGYASQEMIASKANGATITLVEDGKTLEEVVVVGYATQKKSESDRFGIYGESGRTGRKPPDDQSFNRIGRIKFGTVCQSGISPS